MASLVFDIAFAARSDNTPAEDGFTYHHILPWRYYYAAGVILAQVARLYLVQPSAYNAKSKYNATALDAAKAALNTSAKLAAAYGADHVAFRSELTDIKGQALLDLCRSLHGTGLPAGNAINDALTAANGFDFGVIGNLCGAPRFGGFLAMAPEHRCDDLGDAPEPNRPFSLDETHWASLSLLLTHLKAFCPDILGAQAGASVRATVEAATFDLFKTNLDRLVASHNAVPGFQPADWVVQSNGLHAWEYVKGGTSGLTAKQRGRIGKVMRLRTRLDEPAGQAVAQLDQATGAWRVYSPSSSNSKSLAWINA